MTTADPAVHVPPTHIDVVDVGTIGVSAPQRLSEATLRSRLDAAATAVAGSRSVWLVPILMLQALLSLRLHNTLNEDEALYLNAGHALLAHLLHGTWAPHYGHYFSGVPSLYTVPAAIVDSIGGVALVRDLSTGLSLVATIFVYLGARRLFGHGAALVAAFVFVVNASTLFISHFASFDAPSLASVAVAFWLATRVADANRYAVALGPALALATGFKYFAIVFVPVVLALAVVESGQRLRGADLGRRILLTGVVTLGSFGLLAAAMARGDWQGVSRTSTDRRILAPASTATLIHLSWEYEGPLLLVGLLSVLLLRQRRILATLLVMGGWIPAVAQTVLGEATSLHKNMGFGLVFLAPPVGAIGMRALRRGARLFPRAPAVVAGLAVLLSVGMQTSARMFGGWPASGGLVATLRSYVHRGSQSYLADEGEVPAYYLSNVTSHQQWVNTASSEFVGPGGDRAFSLALRRRRFALVILRDGGTSATAVAASEVFLHRYYRLVAKLPQYPHGTTKFWYVWQRRPG